jgi:hypothetical protein
MLEADKADEYASGGIGRGCEFERIDCVGGWQNCHVG